MFLRKWLLPPLRKLSQSKVDKPPPTEKSLVKKTSEKNLRLPHKHTEQDEESSGTPGTASSVGHNMPHFGSGTAAHNTSGSQQNQSQNDFEVEEEAGLELPPPMKPIQEPHLIANGPPTFTKDLKENAANLASTGKMDGNPAIDLSEIEQIVKEKTEQHEEKSKFLKPNFDINNSNNSATNETNGRGLVGVGELNLNYANNENNTIDNNEMHSRTDYSDVKSDALRKRQCSLAELISTEESYVQNLAEIVNGYMAEISNPNSDVPLPEDLKGGKAELVFGNIEDIYKWHRDVFLNALQRCQKSPADLGTLFKRYERNFQMYYLFCRNKPLSEHIVSEHDQYFDMIRQKLGHRLDLSNLIIVPVQRITKYELLLKEITKHTERAGLVEDVPSLKESYHVMRVVVKTANDMMVLRSLQKFEGKISAQGKLLMNGELTCMEDATRNTERNPSSIGQKPRVLQVFLFQQIIIFADIEKRKGPFSSPQYTYRSHIQVNKMQLDELSNNRFLLKSTDPNRPELNMICYAETIDLNREWLETLRNILQSQHDFLKAITSPIQYQKELTKDT